jgi:chromate transporter
VILLVMVALQHLLEKPAFQAVLRGVKPCVIGIILATGIDLILGNVLPEWDPEFRAMALTAVPASVLILSRKITKKGISPIGLICLSAVLGILIYGI